MKFLKQRLADLKQQEVNLEYLLKQSAESATHDIYSNMLLAVRQERAEIESQLDGER
jgi:hypothetical protein